MTDDTGAPGRRRTLSGPLVASRTPATSGGCPVCGRRIGRGPDGAFRWHKADGRSCDGSDRVL